MQKYFILTMSYIYLSFFFKVGKSSPLSYHLTIYTEVLHMQKFLDNQEFHSCVILSTLLFNKDLTEKQMEELLFSKHLNPVIEGS